ncbi:MAG TPA: glycine zipper family protein [Acetobacteraceae bacterium]|nr:glycine zipper family protein [Acetobacteraceae bacterium]
MRRATVFVGLASTLALGACAVAPPPGPSVMAMPGQGKNYAAFQQDDAICRQAATVQTGGASPAVAANNSAVGSAVLGTALGAAAGAALGSVSGAMGAGAAIGGATGLLAGSAIGAGNAQAAGADVQQRYDMVYAQCMTAKGNTVQSAPPGYAAGYVPGYAYAPAYAYPPPYYYPYGPPYMGPGVAIGIGGGWGWDGDRRRWR